MEFGSEEQKDVLPAEDPRRRAALLDRLHRAQRRHRPRLAHHPRRQGRRRVGDQRPEDLHVAGQLRRLHLAGRPHRPRRAQAQGHLDLPGAHVRPRVLVLEDLHDGERQHVQHLLRRRAGAATTPSSTASTGAGTSSSTSSTTSGCRSARRGWSSASTTRCVRWAQDDQAARRPPGHRPGVGAAQPGPGPRQARVPQAHQLEGGVRRRRQPGRRQRHQGVRHRVLHARPTGS